MTFLCSISDECYFYTAHNHFSLYLCMCIYLYYPLPILIISNSNNYVVHLRNSEVDEKLTEGNVKAVSEQKWTIV